MLALLSSPSGPSPYLFTFYHTSSSTARESVSRNRDSFSDSNPCILWKTRSEGREMQRDGARWREVGKAREEIGIRKRQLGRRNGWQEGGREDGGREGGRVEG
jgi:hypothetical protein